MKINTTYLLLLLLPLAMEGVTGCTGVKSFTTAARPGETIALAVGYRQHLQSKNMTVTITDSTGATMIYPASEANTSKVRGVVNLYPDPVSRVRVGNVSGQTNLFEGIKSSALTAGIQSNNYPNGGGTDGDTDWWLTTVLLDLPTTMSNGQAIATGAATITIADTGGNTIRPATVEVLSGSSVPNVFKVWADASTSGSLDVLSIYRNMLKGLERADHCIVSFDATTMPHSVQAIFTHTSGVGKPAVINQRGETKNVTWSDDGAGNLKVMITPPNGATLLSPGDLKFYIAGGLTSVTLSPNSLKAYDINGAPITGVTATVITQ